MAERYEPEKLVWTEADFDTMGWHDVTIHAVAFFPERFEFGLDLDYIFRWVDPEDEGGCCTFWVAAATMVFENAYDIVFEVDTSAGLEVAHISRADPKPPHDAKAAGRDTEWTWTIQCQEGAIRLRSVGYKMFVRTAPVLQGGQTLDPEIRGGISFARSQASGPDSPNED